LKSAARSQTEDTLDPQTAPHRKIRWRVRAAGKVNKLELNALLPLFKATIARPLAAIDHPMNLNRSMIWLVTHDPLRDDVPEPEPNQDDRS
jgi:hypothetical protein